METFSALLAICAGNSPVPGEFPHKGQWRGAFKCSLICTRINDWVNNGDAGDLRRYRAHYDVTVMSVVLKVQLTFVQLRGRGRHFRNTLFPYILRLYLILRTKVSIPCYNVIYPKYSHTTIHGFSKMAKYEMSSVSALSDFYSTLSL